MIRRHFKQKVAWARCDTFALAVQYGSGEPPSICCSTGQLQLQQFLLPLNISSSCMMDTTLTPSTFWRVFAHTTASSRWQVSGTCVPKLHTWFTDVIMPYFRLWLHRSSCARMEPIILCTRVDLSSYWQLNATFKWTFQVPPSLLQRQPHSGNSYKNEHCKQNIVHELSRMLHYENQLLLTSTASTWDKLLARIITNGLLLIPYHDSSQQLFLEAMASVSTVLVACYCKIGLERLIFIRWEQERLRTNSYEHLRDCLLRDDGDQTNVGQHVILPSTFTGCPSYMHE